jgi:hypothetical protein
VVGDGIYTYSATTFMLEKKELTEEDDNGTPADESDDLPAGTLLFYDGDTVHNNGTLADPSDDYGHLVMIIDSVNGVYKKLFDHHTADQPGRVEDYDSDDFTTLVETRFYDISGNLLKKIIPNVTEYTYHVPSDKVYTEYDIATDFLSVYSVTGCLVKERDATGAYKRYSRHFSIGKPRFVEEYDASDNLLAKYEYDINRNIVGDALSTA